MVCCWFVVGCLWLFFICTWCYGKSGRFEPHFCHSPHIHWLRCIFHLYNLFPSDSATPPPPKRTVRTWEDGIPKENSSSNHQFSGVKNARRGSCGAANLQTSINTACLGMLCWESQLRSHVGCHIFFKGPRIHESQRFGEDVGRLYLVYPSRHGSYPAVELTPYTMQSLQVFWHCISEQHEHTWSTTIKMYTLSGPSATDTWFSFLVRFPLWKKQLLGLGPSWDSPTSILHLPPTCYHPTWNHDDSQVVALILPAWRRHILEKVLSEACRQICIDLSICFFLCCIKTSNKRW